MDQVRFELRGGVAHIVLTGAPTNAINRPFVDALTLAIAAVSLSDARALLVSAEGEHFGLGGDIAEWPDKTSRWFTTFIADANAAFQAIEALRIPSIAAVQGACVSGHYELALHCDLIIAADDATFTWIEAKAGMAPLAGGIQRLAQRIGRSRALQHVMLAETLTANHARDLGIVTSTTPAAQLLATATDLAEELAAGPTKAFAAMKGLAKAWANGGAATADALMLDLTMDLFDTNDASNAFRTLADADPAALPKLSYTGS